MGMCMSMWMSIAGVSISGAVALGVVAVGDAAHDKANARSAADAAALAGAAAGEGAASRAAHANGAELVSVEVDGAVTRVVVVFDGVHAEAGAERLIVPITN